MLLRADFSRGKGAVCTEVPYQCLVWSRISLPVVGRITDCSDVTCSYPDRGCVAWRRLHLVVDADVLPETFQQVLGSYDHMVVNRVQYALMLGPMISNALIATSFIQVYYRLLVL